MRQWTTHWHWGSLGHGRSLWHGRSLGHWLRHRGSLGLMYRRRGHCCIRRRGSVISGRSQVCILKIGWVRIL
uniref:Uncharacterized protein n=1 Tax=Amphimedon queenslandica TaxID=400682 RepID=A0A1X7UQ50_AMPQE